MCGGGSGRGMFRPMGDSSGVHGGLGDIGCPVTSLSTYDFSSL